MNCSYRRVTRVTAGLLLATAVAGCARVRPEPDYRRAADEIEQATGVHYVFDPAGQAAVGQRVRELLADGLTAREAVELALLNDPALQAEFYRIGIARAEVVQAGLFSNPSLGLALRLPAGGGLANFEADLAQNIADLWQIPLRKAAAERDLTRVVLEVARLASERAGQARRLYYAVLAAQRRQRIAGENVALARRMLELAQFRQQAGAGSALDVNLARGVLHEAQLNLEESRLAVREARVALVAALGLTCDGQQVQLVDRLPEPPAVELADEALIAVALQRRPDVRALREAELTAERRLALERRRVWPSVELGLGFERGERQREPGRDLLAETARSSLAAGRLSPPEIQPRSERDVNTDFIIGPSLSIELPIFDQNQARIARAAFELAQVRRIVAGTLVTVSQDVRGALARAQSAWRVARFYHDEVLPQARKTLEMSRDSYHAGKSSILSVIEAQRTLLAARQSYAQVLQAAATAAVELELAVGAPFDELPELAAGAASQPTVRNQKAEQQ